MRRRHQASGKWTQKEEQPGEEEEEEEEEQPPCRLAKFTILADTAAVFPSPL